MGCNELLSDVAQPTEVFGEHLTRLFVLKFPDGLGSNAKCAGRQKGGLIGISWRMRWSEWLLWSEQRFFSALSSLPHISSLSSWVVGHCCMSSYATAQAHSIRAIIVFEPRSVMCLSTALALSAPCLHDPFF